ncbi:UNVERIFIED_CONTAM: hypothetical protein Slati_2157300 [Sesamum latifolium]|uniref:Uncharacterized protein n=1 Tax=Sesamum latifolium TaxID=2727402 RepID=A0AAW2WUE2_9LAMI
MDQRIAIDAIGHSFSPVHVSHQSNENEIGISSNDQGGSFVDVVSAADQPLYSSENHSQLSVVARLACKVTKPVKGQKPRRKRSGYATLRYLPITPRLQRLYASNTTAKHMSWHANHETENGVICHPSNAKARKHFNETHSDFASEPRNVCLGLYVDGFAPYGQYGKSYSCWPVIITPCNLPPGMCMKSEYMFLLFIIPGPANHKRFIDVY